MDLTQWTWLIWLGLAVIFVIIELLTLDFTFAMLAAGTALGGLGTTLLGGPWWLQVLLAAALSALLLLILRPLLRRHEDQTRHNVDAIVEQSARVQTDFVEGAGEVKLDNGEVWSARLPREETTPLRTGDRVTVIRVIGATVEVRKEP